MNKNRIELLKYREKKRNISTMNSLSGTFSTSSFTAGHPIEGHKEPYELVIDKTLRSRAKRIQDDTREELSKVLERVENVKS